jgi:hypothetical protein
MEDPKNTPDDFAATNPGGYNSENYLSRVYWPSPRDNMFRPDGSPRPENRPTAEAVLGKDASAVLLLIRRDGEQATWGKVKQMYGSSILTVLQPLIDKAYLVYYEQDGRLAITERVYETMQL